MRESDLPQLTEEARTKRDADISALLTYLDNHCMRLDEFGCYVALSEDRKTFFWCPAMADGSPERDSFDPRHVNWGEVTAPDPEFVEKVNELFGTSFRWEHFPGR